MLNNWFNHLMVLRMNQVEIGKTKSRKVVNEFIAKV